MTVMEKKQKIAYMSFLVLSLILAGIFLFFLPEQVPMQWGMDGSVNYYLPKYLAVLVLPALTAVFVFRGWVAKDLANLGYGIISLVGVSGVFVYIWMMY